MKQTLHPLGRCLAIGVIMLYFGAAQAQRFPWQDTSRPLDWRVEWLVGQLTLDEKLSLMVHQNPAIERVGLPAYSWWNEALHGVARAGTATVYPMPVALAATFDSALVGRVFRHVGVEARRKHREAQDTGYFGDYSGLTFFTPNINIFRDPRWGRGMETYGEDPFLTATMGLQCVNGLQSTGAAACIKHLAVHSGPEGVRHEFDSRVGDADLRTTYLPAFEYIVSRSKVAQVMCGYNRLNGEPCCTNRDLLVGILRNEWRYDGILVTDCWALNDAYERDTVIPRHKTHPSAALAYGDAFGSEVDLECGSGLPALRQAVSYGYVPESKVDEHVRRVLRTRLAATDPQPAVAEVDVPSPVDVAARSMVLLKNNGVLPLRPDVQLRLEGPNMWDTLMPLGNYNGTPEHCVTIGEALSSSEFGVRSLEFGVWSSEFGVRSSEFGGWSSESGVRSSEVGVRSSESRVGSAQISELRTPNSELPTVIYAGGLNPQLEGEELPVEKEGFYRGDRTRIELPQEQVDDLRALKAAGHRVVLVLCTGSAIALENVVDYCDAILVGWYGGEAMGTAVRQLLYGERDDFGRLPVTFYRNTQQLPPFDDYDMHRRTYRYMTDQPLYPFGYGLNYGQLRIEEVIVDQQRQEVRGVVEVQEPVVSFTRAVVQLYLAVPGSDEAKRLVGTATVMVPSSHPRAAFSIKVDPFWLRQYDELSGRMEFPVDGAEIPLKIGLSSSDNELMDLPFIYRR